MNLICPFCSTPFRAAVEEPLKSAVRLACPSCHRDMVLRPQPASPPAAVRRKAVIADEARPFRAFLQQELERIGFEVHAFDSGDKALDAIRQGGSDLVIVNVALRKGKMGVELAEEIKKDPELSHTRVALTGPLFRANRFRNDPATLYGADDYIEEQIPAAVLEQRIGDLFSQEVAPEPRLQDAQRLARLILSDIVIAHPERVEQGIRGGTFFEVLKKEIDEGRVYYEKHVPPRIRQSSEYFTKALQEFVQMKSEEL